MNSRFRLMVLLFSAVVCGACGDDGLSAPDPRPGPDPESATISGIEGVADIVVRPEAVALRFRTQPSNGRAGEAFDPAIEVEIVDEWGNRVEETPQSVEVSLGSNPSGAELKGTLEDVSEIAKAVFNVVIETAGSGYTIVASAEGLEPAESRAFDIWPAEAESLRFLKTPASVEGREPFTVSVGLYDRYDNLATTTVDSIRSELAENPSGDTRAGTLVRPVVDGVATFDDLILQLPGDGYRLEAIRLDGSGQVTSDVSSVGVTFESVVVGGNSHVCGLTEAGHIYCWGGNAGYFAGATGDAAVPVKVVHSVTRPSPPRR